MKIIKDKIIEEVWKVYKEDNIVNKKFQKDLRDFFDNEVAPYIEQGTEKALSQQKQEIIKEIDKIIKKQEELSDKEMKMVYMPYREFGIGLLYYLKQELTE